MTPRFLLLAVLVATFATFANANWVDKLLNGPAADVSNFTRLYFDKDDDKKGKASGKITIGNHTYYSCTPDMRGNDCAAMLPGMMTECYDEGNSVPLTTDGKANGKSVLDTGITPVGQVCGCYQLYGLEHPPSVKNASGIYDPYCFTAHCLEQKDACSQYNGKAYFVVIMTSLLTIAFVAEFFFCIYLILGIKKKKEPLLNVAGTTLINATIGTFFAIMFCITYPVMFGSKSWFYLDNIGIPVGLTFMAVFGCISFLNLALMWLEVSFASKTMKKTGRNLSKKPLIFVIVFDTVIFLFLLIVMTIMKDYFIGGAISIVFIIVIMVLYLAGARELDQVMSAGSKGPKSPRLLAITKTARQMFGCMLFFVIIDIVYALSAGFRSPRPALTQVLHVVGIVGILGSWIVMLAIIIEYIRDATLVKRGFKRKAGSKMATTQGSGTTSATSTGND